MEEAQYGFELSNVNSIRGCSYTDNHLLKPLQMKISRVVLAANTRFSTSPIKRNRTVTEISVTNLLHVNIPSRFSPTFSNRGIINARECDFLKRIHIHGTKSHTVAEIAEGLPIVWN